MVTHDRCLWVWVGAPPGFPGGDTWRNTVVTIIQNPNVTKPAVRFVSEDPFLQYNVEIQVGRMP